jgi:2,3,4,5-tetrahydropyridine-2,6-dicarboxylate N-succinyltransferase
LSTSDSLSTLKSAIERLSTGETIGNPDEARRTFLDFRAALTRGEVRAAEKRDERWVVNAWVKQGILLGFRLGELQVMSDGDVLSFVDKDTFPPRRLTLADRVRLVPGGSSIREGAYVAPSVICMPPMFINVGAYVDEGSMIDSHALVGSCAQIGKRVHLSAAAQIGGVLEPVNAAPVIIEDDVLVGGNCGVYEGTLVRARGFGSGDNFDPIHTALRSGSWGNLSGVTRATVGSPGKRRSRPRLARGEKGQGPGVESLALHTGDCEVSRRENRTRR